MRQGYKHETPRTMTKKELQERNAAFNALPPMKKRVAVAKDVLLMLGTGKFVAEDGYGVLRKKGGLLSVSSFENLQPILQLSGIVCEGCAKAAAVVAKARLGNDVYGWIADNAHSVSDEVFGESLSKIIECVYEDWVERDELMDFSYREAVAIKKFARSIPGRFDDPKARMIAIYQNIVTNRGRFVVGKYKY